jgi:hypothetical protein
MMNKAIHLIIFSITLSWASSLNAQNSDNDSADRGLIIEMYFDGVESPAVQEQFRETVFQGLQENSDLDVYTDAVSRDLMGEEAERLMLCGDNPTCLGELRTLTGAISVAVSTVSKAGDIYAFTLDLYNTDGGEGLFFGETECPLCTIEEALADYRVLAENAVENLVILPSVVENEVRTSGQLLIQTRPEEAIISLDGERIGEGEVMVQIRPGRYSVVATLEGYRTIEQQITVEEGDPQLNLILRLREDSVSAQASTQRGNQRDGNGLEKQALWGGVLLGTGLVGMIYGSFLINSDGEPACADDSLEDCPEILNTAAGGTALTILSTAAMTSGLFLLIWDRLSANNTSDIPNAANLGFSWEPRRSVLSISGTF